MAFFVAAALLALGLVGCGGTSNSTIVVRVGSVSITKATVDHWTRVVERGGAFDGFRGRPSGTARRQALALLISSNWLTGEAARAGVPISGEAISQAQVERGLDTAEFRTKVAATGQTLAGAKLALGRELALEAIRERLASRIGPITRPQAEQFYRAHLAQFSPPVARVIDIIKTFPSAQVARRVVARVGTGSHFTRLAQRKTIALTPGVLLGSASKKAVDYAINAARPGVVSQPMPLGERWAVFIVRKVLPSRPEPFAKVRGDVTARLRRQREVESTRALERDYRAYWTSRTSCRPEYVAPGCAQYKGRLGEYEDPFTHI